MNSATFGFTNCSRFTTCVNIKLVREGAKVPTKEFPNSAGYDICNPMDVQVPAGRSAVKLGFCIEMLPGIGMFSLSRSGIGLKGILGYASREAMLAGDKPRRFECNVKIGLADADFRGECSAIMHNHDRSFFLPEGANLCQVVFLPVLDAEFSLVDELSPSDRGEQGFHS